MNKLEKLKSLIGGFDGQLRRQYHTSRLVSPGIPKGAITQVVGPGKTSFVIEFLSEHSDLKATWIESALSLYPIAVAQRQVQLERLLFVECGDHDLWTSLQVIRSGLFPVITLSNRSRLNDRNLRRLQLAAEKTQSSLLLLSTKSISAWPIAMQIETQNSHEGLRTQVMRRP